MSAGGGAGWIAGCTEIELVAWVPDDLALGPDGWYRASDGILLKPVVTWYAFDPFADRTWSNWPTAEAAQRVIREQRMLNADAEE